MSAIKDFLSELAMMQKARCANPKNGWYTTGHFVLKNGRCFTPTNTLPKGLKPGTPRDCFRNAANLAIDRGLIYCEGYGLSIIPVPHAWCLTPNGEVVDPTWATRLPASELFGVAIQTGYLSRTLLQNRHYGLIDAWRSDWPMLHDPPEEWRHPIMGALRGAAR